MPKSPRVNKTNQANRDLAEIAEYYGGESLDLELRFIEAAEEAFSNLAAMPEKGAKREYFHPKLKGLRMWSIPDFPKILIFYNPQENGVEVVRVLHSSRDIDTLFTKGRKP